MDRKGLTMREIEARYAESGHPSLEELAVAQGTVYSGDPRTLLGDFWPDDQPVDDFLAALREWRGHPRHDRAA